MLDFGFKTPELLLRLIQTASDISAGDPYVLNEILGFSVHDPIAPEKLFGCCYNSTPPELIPFGNLGVDGAHAGYIVLAPELPADDYPVGCYCPMDFDDGIIFYGKDTRDFLEMRFADTVQCWDEWSRSTAEGLRKSWPVDSDETALADSARRLREDADRNREKYEPVIQNICRELGLMLDPSRETSFIGGGNFMPEPTPLAGWKWLPTWDKAGVFAPEKFFTPGPLEKPPVERCAKDAKRFLAGGYPASALYCIKANSFDLVCERKNKKVVSALGLAADAYDELNRPLLAAAVRNRIDLMT